MDDEYPQNLRRFMIKLPQNRPQNAKREWMNDPHPIHKKFCMHLTVGMTQKGDVHSDLLDVHDRRLHAVAATFRLRLKLRHLVAVRRVRVGRRNIDHVSHFGRFLSSLLVVRRRSFFKWKIPLKAITFGVP